MSIQHVGAVLHEMPELRGLTDAFVLAVVADSADRRTGWTYDLWLADIAKSSRQTVRNVQKRLRALELAGYVRTKLKGKPGRQRCQFRVLFDFNGKRMTEEELYPTPERRTGAQPGTPVPRSPAPVPRSPAPVPKVAPPNNPLIGVPSLSVSTRKSEQKLAGPRTKKIPAAKPPPDLEAERQRQTAELKRRIAAKPERQVDLEELAGASA